MNIEIIAAIVFLIFLTFFLIYNRKKLVLHKILFPLLYFAMYKTKLGLKLMDSIARHKRTVKVFGYIGVAVGYIGMVLIGYTLIKSLIDLILTPQAAAGVALVLPFPVKGAFYVPFFYWIISIFIIATVHEFSHGVVARAHDIKIKSSGFAFLGVIIPVIPAAFVETDEKQLKKKPYRQQLSVFAAGPFSNIVLAVIVILMMIFLISPLTDKMVEYKGVKVTGFVADINAANNSGIKIGQTITKVDNIQITSIDNLTKILDNKKSGDSISVMADNSTYIVTLGKNPKNSTKAYLGTYLEQDSQIKESLRQKYWFLPDFTLWLAGLFFWLYVLNLGIGLFNLVPLGPVDGGRMLQVTLYKFFKDKRKADIIWKYIGLFFLALILFSLIFSLLK